MNNLLGSALLDLVLPQGCAGCGAHTQGQALCAGCVDLLRAPTVDVLPPAGSGLPGVGALGPYDGELRLMILAHKEYGRLALTRPLGFALARAIGRVLANPPCEPVALVPVPSSPQTTRQRGHDPVRRMALVAAGLLRRHDVPAYVVPVLQLARPVADQAGLGAAERHANLAGAMALNRRAEYRLDRRPVILVDDILTSGATLSEASRALRAGGVRLRGAAVLAATAARGTADLLDAAAPLD